MVSTYTETVVGCVTLLPADYLRPKPRTQPGYGQGGRKRNKQVGVGEGAQSSMAPISVV